MQAHLRRSSGSLVDYGQLAGSRSRRPDSPGRRPRPPPQVRRPFRQRMLF
ncbi:hypothetical protein [Microbulbifer halophilus]